MELLVISSKRPSQKNEDGARANERERERERGREGERGRKRSLSWQCPVLVAELSCVGRKEVQCRAVC